MHVYKKFKSNKLVWLESCGDTMERISVEPYNELGLQHTLLADARFLRGFVEVAYDLDPA